MSAWLYVGPIGLRYLFDWLAKADKSKLSEWGRIHDRKRERKRERGRDREANELSAL